MDTTPSATGGAVVRFKLKADPAYTELPLDAGAASIRAGDLKRAIVQRKFNGSTGAFGLKLINNATGEEYVDEGASVPADASILVKRVPFIVPMSELPSAEASWTVLSDDDELNMAVTRTVEIYKQSYDETSPIGIRRTMPCVLEGIPWGVMKRLLPWLARRWAEPDALPPAGVLRDCRSFSAHQLAGCSTSTCLPTPWATAERLPLALDSPRIVL